MQRRENINGVLPPFNLDGSGFKPQRLQFADHAAKAFHHLRLAVVKKVVAEKSEACEAKLLLVFDRGKRRSQQRRIFKIAEALVKKAAEGDIACIREVADRLDGKAQVIGDDGAVQLSFVVRLPEQLSPEDWARTVGQASHAPRPMQPHTIQHIDIQPREAQGAIAEPTGVTGLESVTELGPIDGPHAQSETDLVSAHSLPAARCRDTADTHPLLPGTPPVVLDRTGE